MAVTVQQAASNAFAAWLQSLMPDVKVLGRWPAPDYKLPEKAISVIFAGRRRDLPLDTGVLSHVNSGDTDTAATYRIAMCEQPLQLDVWARTHGARDDIVARLDGFLRYGARALDGAYNPDPFAHGVLVALGDEWPDATADFDFDSPDMDDSGDDIGASDYRAIYRGSAHMMLTLTATTARQKTQNFQLKLKETDGSFYQFA